MEIDKHLLIILILFFSVNIFAQYDNSTDTTLSAPMGDESSKNYVPAYTFQYNKWYAELPVYNLVDTSIYNNHRTEILSASRNLYAHTGLLGQVAYPMNYHFQRTHGFVYKTMPFSLYHRKIDNWQWHYVPESYTRIDYEWGTGKENMFNVIHSQSIYDLSFEIDFTTMIAEGLFTGKQSVRDLNAGIRLSYHTPNSRYGFDFAYIYNLFYLNENGGILNDSLFEARVDIRNLAIKEPNAYSNYQDHDVFYRHYIALSKKGTDSNETHFNLGYVLHDIEFTSLKTLYNNRSLNPSYYHTFNYDSLFTFDSLTSYQFKNSLMWSNYMYNDSILMQKNNFIYATVGIAHTYIKVGDSSARFFCFQLTPFTNVHLRFARNIDLKMNLLYTINGYNNQDISAGLHFSWQIPTEKDIQHTLSFKSNFYKYQPDYFYTYYFANTYNWENENLKKQQLFQATLEWQYDKYIIDFNYYTLQNTLVIGENMLPIQFNKTANIYQLATLLPFRYKGFGFESNMFLQYATQKYIPMPWFAGRGSVFYGFNMFKKAMFTQLGLEVLYNTPYYAHGYNPVMQQFFYQNTKKIGNHTYFDFFVNIKVSRFYFHFVLGNFLADLLPKKHYLILHYPTKGLNFKVGASWRFHD
ncbi:MAG: putative porin [Bacteroidales bacterium]|nr:putative porin [Bacteroidales bacterium]